MIKMPVIEYAAFTDSGLRKKRNEDSYYIPYSNANVQLAIVADGIGGYNAGDIASKKTVEVVSNIINQKYNISNPSLLLLDSIQKANEAVLEYAKTHEFCEGMGTTIVAALHSGKKWLIANIGDSRAYLYSKKKLSQITVDHSLVQEMYEEDSITTEEMRTNPYRNIITRAIGTDYDVNPDIFYTELKNNEMLLLCSDGLIEHLTDDAILEIINTGDEFKDIPKLLVERANNLGGLDNTTVVVLRNGPKRSLR